MKVSLVRLFILLLMSISQSACNQTREEPLAVAHKVSVSTVESKDVTLNERYICQIRAQHHINVRAPESGFITEIPIHAGQPVEKFDVLFKLKGAKGTPEPIGDDIIFPITAPFDGRVDRPAFHQGSFVEKGQTLVTLSDSSVIWAYFNMPEAKYLEFISFQQNPENEEPVVELQLVNGSKFVHRGKLAAIGANFNPDTGTISFRADFPNPELFLRHGQTGTLIISRVHKNAVVIPQQATFDLFNKRYVYVVDKNNVIHHREIAIEDESNDLFVIRSGISVDETIVVDGIEKLMDGDEIVIDGRTSKNVVANLKYHVK